MTSTAKQIAHLRIYETLFKILRKKLIQGPLFVMSLFPVNFAWLSPPRAWGVWNSVPERCPFLLGIFQIMSQGLSLGKSVFALCSVAVNVTVLGLEDSTAMTARSRSVKTHIVLSNIDPQVNNGTNDTRPDKCGTEGGNTGPCILFMKNRSRQTRDGL